MGQREVRIELDRAVEMFDGAVAIVARQRAEDETRKQIAATQILLVSDGILRRRLRDADLLRRTEPDAQSFDDSLGDRVLHRDDVRGGRVDAIAPQQLA